jgi:hypothetical protein
MVTRSDSKCASISTVAQSGGYGGLTADAERVILRNGSTVVIRLLAAGDEAAIARWFAGLSAETRYARFFGFLEQLDRRTASALARVDHFNHEAIAPLAADGTHGRNRALPPHLQARSRLRWPTTGGVSHRSHPARTDRNQGAFRRDRAIHRDVSCNQ